MTIPADPIAPWPGRLARLLAWIAGAFRPDVAEPEPWCGGPCPGMPNCPECRRIIDGWERLQW